MSDDLWIMAKNPAELGTMLQTLFRILNANGISLNMGKSSWWSGTFEAQPLQLLFSAPIPCTSYFQVLGFPVTGERGGERSFQELAVRVWRLFWKHSRVYRHAGTPARKRIKLMLTSMQSLLRWFAPASTWSVPHDRSLDILQRRVVRAALGRKRGREETWLHFWRRTHREAGQFLSQYGFCSWSLLATRFKMQWAGHIARAPETSLSYQALLHRGLPEWRANQVAHPSGSERHGSEFGRQLRWEHRLESEYAAFLRLHRRLRRYSNGLTPSCAVKARALRLPLNPLARASLHPLLEMYTEELPSCRQYAARNRFFVGSDSRRLYLSQSCLKICCPSLIRLGDICSPSAPWLASSTMQLDPANLVLEARSSTLLMLTSPFAQFFVMFCFEFC